MGASSRQTRMNVAKGVPLPDHENPRKISLLLKQKVLGAQKNGIEGDFCLNSEHVWVRVQQIFPHQSYRRRTNR